MKMQRLITPILIVAACASAQAAVQLVSLPNLPLSLPSRNAPQAVTLPSRLGPGAVALPSPAMLPIGPTTLPSAPVPMPSIQPGVKLPGPRAIPAMPLRLDQAVTDQKTDRVNEKLGNLYDGRPVRVTRRLPILEDNVHTLPEHDLRQEIGIDSY